MPLHVAFLWHMHQPYYVDPVHKTALMPWVRLHATKGYLDMIWLVEQVPEFHCTFNLTPVLLKQIRELAGQQVRDAWHDLTRIPPEALTPEQKRSLLEHYFKAHWENMIKPYPRYWALLQKRGLQVASLDLNRVAGTFSDQEYRDLQVWFNLTWFGYAANELFPELAELKRKGRDFTEADKQVVLNLQDRVLQSLLDRYRAAAERGQVELSTTPFYHPILPLVYNTEFARRCMPGRDLPVAYARPEDVRAQLALARDNHTEIFGTPPAGIWPSEGSVCPELVPILEELGYQWFATDEEVLWRSLSAAHPGQNHDRSRLFQGYRARHGDQSVCAAFRDRTLSDFIGFNAARNEPHQAADFLVRHLESNLHTANGHPDGLCAVVLDGENAWEHFRDGGENFLRELYQRLAKHEHLRSTTLRDYFASHQPTAQINTLHTGSWINADFDIWIGDPEENRAWTLLGRTREFVQGKIDRGEATPEQAARALNEIYAAEGSDWFWWYGGDFVTDNDLIFDELFRVHLQNAYRVLDAPVPELLKTNICRSEIRREIQPPTQLIKPTIDGRVTSYYEWTGAGHYEAGRGMAAMYQSERHIQRIYFGADLENLYIRIDFLDKENLPVDGEVQIHFIEPDQWTLRITDLLPAKAKGEVWRPLADDGMSRVAPFEGVRFDQVLEIAIPYAANGWQPKQRVLFSVEFAQGKLELERHPDLGALQLVLPDTSFETENWYV